MTTPTLISSFRYEQFPQDKAQTLRDSATRIRGHVRTATAAIIEIGRELISTKRYLDHGEFTEWVETECGFSVRSAENYMRAADFAAGRNATVSLLRPATVYRLARKSTPPEVVTAVIESLEAGRVPTDCEIAVMLDQGRHSRSSARRIAQSAKQPTNVRPVELAAAIVKGLGLDIAVELAATWDTVGECLHRALEMQARSASPNMDVTGADASEVYALDLRSRSPAEECEAELVRDPANSDLYRPKTAVVDSRADDLDIPEFLDRSKNGIGARTATELAA